MRRVKDFELIMARLYSNQDANQPEMTEIERVGMAANCLRFASIHLIVAGEEGLADRVDDIIAIVDRLHHSRAN